MRKWVLIACLVLSVSGVAAEEDSKASGVEKSSAAADVWRGDFEYLRDKEADSVVCPFKGEVDYEEDDVACGLIKVPENREVEGSRTIELHYVRLKAQPDRADEGEDGKTESGGESSESEDGDAGSAQVRNDPVLYLTGGPGVEVTGYVERLKDHSLLHKRDLYILEQRGIGYSGEFCEFFAGRNRAERIKDTFEGQQRAMMEASRECIENAKAQGVDVRGYNTIENARDVKALRMALGFDQWNIWGISYGSVLGQAVLKADPGGVKAMVIDAIVPLNLKNLMRIAHWYRRDLDKLFAACEEQEDCREAYPNLEDRFFAAIEDMAADPVTVEVEESEQFPTGEAHFFQDVVGGMPFGLMYEQSNHPAIPAIMDALARVVETRDKEFFRAMASAPGGAGGPSVSMGMAISVRCQDHYADLSANWAPVDKEKYPTLSKVFGDIDVTREMSEGCRAVGLGPRDYDQYDLVETDIPIVVANGAWDPITPPPLAESIMDGFENGRYVEFPHAGHGPTRSLDCAGDFLNDFYDDPSAELDMECVKDGEEPAEYIADYYSTRAPFDALIMRKEDKKALAGHGAWGGVSLFFPLIGFFAIGFAWAGDRINGARRPANGRARVLIFLSALASLGYVVGLGYAGYATNEITPAMFVAGFVPAAGWFAWLAPLAGLLAIAGVVQLVRYRHALPRASRIGLVLVGVSVVSLATFGFAWDLWPF